MSKTKAPKNLVSLSSLARRIRTKPIMAVIAASLLTLIVVTSFGISKLSSPAPFTLAMVTTLSGGPQASQGREALNGAQIYIDKVNAAGGVNGHPLKLQVFDDKFDAKHAESVARQVTASPALLTLGPIYSATVPQPINTIYAKARLPMIAASVSYDDLTGNPVRQRHIYNPLDAGRPTPL